MEPAQNTSQNPQPSSIPPSEPQTTTAPASAPQPSYVTQEVQQTVAPNPSIIEPPQIAVTGKKSGLKKIILSLVFLVVLLVLVGSVFGAYAIAYEKIKLTKYQDLQKKISDYVISLPFMPKTPKYLLAKSAYVHQNVTKESFDISLAIESQDLISTMGLSGLDVQAKGSIDYSTPKNIKFNLNASITKDFNVELLKLDKFLYFKINKIPQVFLTALGLQSSDLQPIYGKWVAYDTSPLDTEARHSIEDKEVDPLSEQYIDEEFQKYLDEKVLSKMTLEEVKEDGFDVYKITLVADSELIDYLGKKLDEENKKKTGSSLNVLGASSEKLSDTVKSLTWKINIDKKDYYTRKIVITSDVEVDSLGSESLYLGNSSSVPKTSKAKIGFAAKFGDFGKEFDVKPPENSINTEEFLNLISEIVQKQYGTALNSGSASYASSRDARRKADLQILRSGLELYRADSQKYPSSLAELTPTYLSQIPTDPFGSSYYYLPSSDKKSYDLCAILETPSPTDPQCPDLSYNYHVANP